MAAPRRNSNAHSVARLLNLNSVDSEAYFEVVNDYFGDRKREEEYDSCSEVSDDEDFRLSDPDSDPDDADQYQPVTVDLAETLMPLHRDPASIHSERTQVPSSSTTQPQTHKVPCNCKLNNGTPCHTHFDTDEIESFVLQYVALTNHELDLVVLSKIASGLHLDKETCKSRQSSQTERKLSRVDYYHHGHRICRDFFKYIHSISQDKLTALIKHYKACGVEGRIHKNTKKRPKNSLQYNDTRRVIDFVLNYADLHGIQLPGRTPKHWVTDCKLLPTNCTKASVYAQYKAAAESDGHRIVKLRTFRQLWQTVVPFVTTMPPASDLCWICQQGATKIARCANKPDDQKNETIRQLEAHQQSVQREREFYQQICAVVKQSPPPVPRGRHPYCSYNGRIHVSFDYAQQLHYPYNPLQPGPIYFKTPRKCGLFGINCEGISKQVNYLIDEAHCSGKGANVVVSYLHHYLEHYSFGETELYLHADNCCGQNKNGTMIMYLMWRCVTGRHENIRLSFLISGHTKFSPDGGFGLIKRLYRKTKVDCLKDIEDVVNASSVMNEAVVVGEENGSTRINAYDWGTYLSQFFKKVKQVKKYHHFLFGRSGTVICKTGVDAAEERQVLQICPPPADEMPAIIPANGLPLKRQWYLYKEIRPFVAERCQDVVTPKPQEDEQEQESDSEEEEQPTPPQAKKQKSYSTRGRGRGRGRAGQ